MEHVPGQVRAVRSALYKCIGRVAGNARRNPTSGSEWYIRTTRGVERWCTLSRAALSYPPRGRWIGSATVKAGGGRGAIA